MEQHSDRFLANAAEALADPQRVQRRDAMALFAPLLRSAAVDADPGYAANRDYFSRVRRHCLDHLDHYLARFEQEALDNGNRVHFARDGDELNSIVLEICQQHGARRVAKGKSMVTEETGLTPWLERAGLTVTETDLGEYIIQQAGETPSHIVAPALHKSADEIRELFFTRHRRGPRDLAQTADLVDEARQVLRPQFLQADIGIIGSNALIAENGYSLLVTNEGNGDLCASLPPVLIICTTIDRVLPRMEDAGAMLRVLVRSATGQTQTCYTSFYSGPRRATDPDGPLETHIVLLDNGRGALRAGKYREMLACIRCGACLNHCPIYMAAGGHAFGWVYPGPMGSVLTPLLTSLEASNALPNACTACGRCAEVCPADIPLPDLLRDLRAEEVERKLGAAHWRIGLRLHSWLARRPRLYHALTGALVPLLHRFAGRRGALSRLPLAGGWSAQRDFPAPARRTFLQLYRDQRLARRREH